MDADGWYGQIHYAVPSNGTTTTPFYRYDTFDDGDDWERHTFGVAFDYASKERITVEWENVDDDGDTEDNISLRWQVKY
jgi:hypothetical protein